MPLTAVPNGNILTRYRPDRLSAIAGQPAVVKALAAFVANPFPTAMIFAGASGVGKTATAWALAAELGCDPEWGGVAEIPAGKQDGKAVDELFRSLHLRPMSGSGWKVAIINEADRMTDQAEAIWLDALERLPPKSVVVFTTNNLRRLSERFRRRCEVYQFDSTSNTFRDALYALVRRVWKEQTGRALKKLPEGLGKFEAADDNYSMGLALQQIAPYIRTGEPLPDAFVVPIVRFQPTMAEAKPGSDANRSAMMATTRFFCRRCRTWGRKGAPAVWADGEWRHQDCSPSAQY